MIEIISVVIFSLFLMNWSASLVSVVLVICISLMQMNFSFSSTLDSFFFNSTISSLLIFLSCLLCFLSLVCTPEEMTSWSYKLCLSFLLLMLVFAFSTCNIIMFYVFFEASLIPTLFLIIGWGYQPERLQAGTYMMLYTVGASLPLLAMILWYCSCAETTETFILHLTSSPLKGMPAIILYGAFLVKLPMYGVHLWLPKAHVEAPLAGSMILAGILLKLGGFGLMQMIFCFNLVMDSYSTFIFCMSMWGGLLATLMCLRQVDVKSLVAYSSVGHMSIVSAGLLMDSSWGVVSAVITMMAHGFSSSALFCLAYFSYKKSHTRNIPYMKGMLQVYPVLSMYWFILCCVNMACPPTLNLVGEMLIVGTLWNNNLWLACCMGMMVLFSASYNMYLYSSLNHGGFSSYFLSGQPLKSYSMIGLFGHLFPLILILKCDLFLFYSLLDF
uniref:NADH-ubiquinone oxidoreductase chain 4 n=1 Tax=Phyllidiella hageni TaxID=2873953 RepID=A0AA96RQ25_9GAST|nr:NADH dehydrogenase subunit 4 [Phyllidiella hageni]WNR50678.1 NADH dehydrogenase subunit 4 [Phyllidiella hageni]WNR50691.1 NADH dehydrogenase subunit 4 [Phyllidiella hageni]WNR50704.1 NADH dehydrogenase subunit 4 [Phyllidiella hageni]